VDRTNYPKSRLMRCELRLVDLKYEFPKADNFRVTLARLWMILLPRSLHALPVAGGNRAG